MRWPANVLIGAVVAWHGINSACAIEPDALFAQLDANGDGQLAAEEAGKERRLLFRRLVRTSDADGDGLLSAEEFAAGLQPVRAEKAMVQKEGSKLPGSDALLVMMAKMDVNQDRQLDASEIPADYKFLFDRMLGPGDADKNGRLDQREISQFAPQLGLSAAMGAARLGIDVQAELERLPSAQRMAMARMDAYARPADMLTDPAQAVQLFARLDADGDQFVTLEEVTGPLAQRLEEMLPRLDRNRDGKLSKDEFMAMARRIAAFNDAPADPQEARRLVRQLLRRFDSDGDGALSVREAPRRMAENFDRTDQNADGKLDAGELEAVAQTISRMQLGGRRRGGGFGPPRMVESESDGAATPSTRSESRAQQRRERSRSRRDRD